MVFFFFGDGVRFSEHALGFDLAVFHHLILCKRESNLAITLMVLFPSSILFFRAHSNISHHIVLACHFCS